MRSLRSRLGAACLALAAAAATITVTAPAAQAAYPPGFRSVGYLPSWSGSVSSIQYSKLTHINYSFVLPNSNGTLQGVPDTGKLQQLVSLGHQNGVKVSIAVGGWNDGNDDNFEILAASANGRTTFVNALVNLVNQYNLDGVDIDWEYPDPGTEGDNYTLLMRQLGDALHSRGKLLTAAVVSEGGTANGVQPAVFGIVDWLNIMAYDGGSPHANYDWSINSVNFWKNRGLPASKAVLGVPFYSRPTYIAYRDLVAQDPANANRDCYNGNCYNGIPTIKRKTTWAVANAGGIMNWELSQDTTGSTSLLNAIWEAAGGGTQNPPTGGTITGYGGKCVDVAGASSANGTAVQLWTCNGTNAQQWTRNGQTLRALGKCLDASGTANGAVTQLWDCTGAGNQQWTSESNGQLRNVASGRCLDATGPSSADGTRLQLWDCAATANQLWRLNA
ncbi:glycosyl hydrolase family 18 protein [Nocardia sp. NRRL S-836]|uniref:glycosyl hydrolase family 18 protein n=1 Tax=Nocardia sp. NRRL S-836 TaxID=1519492 RepID=UPI0006AEFC28|nr:glycosyl hydrolase family 18 protein [Nocardia sp. NRRL S-836]KOV81728.1 glycoside hydrolase family 18 [Nocardia sp. NRRL S-836]